MRQSRNSFASASVDFATGLRNPMPYSFDGCAPRHDSMSRKLSLKVNCANAIARNCSVQRNLRTRRSPSYFATKRSKLVHGTKSMTCEKSVRPKFTVALPIGKNRENYRRFVKRVQIDTKSNQHQHVE